METDRQKGKLTIFFGYCAGVGKTYAMLNTAQQKSVEGTDVVIGYIEPHERKRNYRSHIWFGTNTKEKNKL